MDKTCSVPGWPQGKASIETDVTRDDFYETVQAEFSKVFATETK